MKTYGGGVIITITRKSNEMLDVVKSNWRFKPTNCFAQLMSLIYGPGKTDTSCLHTN